MGSILSGKARDLQGTELKETHLAPLTSGFSSRSTSTSTIKHEEAAPAPVVEAGDGATTPNAANGIGTKIDSTSMTVLLINL